jgi:superfamily II DNA or RNA helicase
LQVEYYELCQRIKAAKSKLIAEFSFQENPFGVFLDQVSKAAQETKNSANHLACEYISCFSRRKQMLSEFEGKYTALRLLESVLFSADKTLVFNLTVAGAESSSEILSSLGLRSAVVHSGLHISERNSAMVSFKRGSIKALCAPLVLDEGIDVPAADLAIVIAGNRSMRQFIQRLGRVIRKKTDGRSANIYIMYVEDTLEDPSEYFNQRVYGGIEDGADSINYIDASTGVLKEMKNPVKQGPLIRTLSESTNSKSQYNQQEAILDITTRHIIPNDTVIKIPGTNIDNLSQLLSLLKKESIPFENNRLLNGSIWVYKNDREFGEYAEYLRSLGVSVKYYPHGRSRRAGEQYELDPRKVLK